MGRRGPKPKPSAIKKFERNPGKRRLNKSEPKPAPLVGLEPPKGMGDVAQRHWRTLAPRLQQLGILSELDVNLLTLYCEAWQDKHDCEKTLESGEYFHTESGFVGQHPAVNRLAKALERIRKLGAEFGLSPSARSNLDLGNKKPAGKLGKYVANG